MKKFNTYEELQLAIIDKEITFDEFRILEEQFEEQGNAVVNELVANGNTYLAELITLKDKSEKDYQEEKKLQNKLYELQRQRREAESRISYLMNLQYDVSPKYPEWERSYNESEYRKENYTSYRLWAGNDFHVHIKERTALKVWKFEVTYFMTIDKEMIKGDEVYKFKTLEEAENQADVIKTKLFADHKDEIDKRFELQKQAYEVQTKLSKFASRNQSSYTRKLYK